jgi:hypothetical protein
MVRNGVGKNSKSREGERGHGVFVREREHTHADMQFRETFPHVPQ